MKKKYATISHKDKFVIEYHDNIESAVDVLEKMAIENRQAVLIEGETGKIIASAKQIERR